MTNLTQSDNVSYRESSVLKIYLEVGFDSGKITGGVAQFSFIVVKTSSVNRPPTPERPEAFSIS